MRHLLDGKDGHLIKFLHFQSFVSPQARSLPVKDHFIKVRAKRNAQLRVNDGSRRFIYNSDKFSRIFYNNYS